MSSDAANVSAFVAYSQTPNTSVNKSKRRSSGYNISFEQNEISELKEFVKRSKKKSRKRRDESQSKVPKTSDGNKSNESEKNKKQVTKKKTEDNRNELSFTKDFNTPPNYLQGTSTPSLLNGHGPKKRQPTTDRQTTAKNGAVLTRIREADSALERLHAEGSIAVARHHLQWILNPVDIDDFKQSYWEKAPICINRFMPQYYAQLISSNAIDKMLRENIVEYTKNMDVTSYRDGVRETHNPEGRALPPSVWDFYRDGCSIRLLNPQTFIPQIHELIATLQEYFQCMVGANVYLTPPNSQGFSPHYDDIEAFILMIEGKKQWQLYAPRTADEFLPRVSSGNFRPDEIGEPIMERTLEPGDLLYFPRGTIHQAKTVPGHHSLHITLSVYQKTAIGDLMEILLPRALQRAINSDVEFRRGLPFNIWNDFGLVNQDEDTEQRAQITTRIKKIFEKVVDHLNIDEAVDQMAIKYQHDAMPPAISAAEAPLTVYGSKCTLTKYGKVEDFQFEIDTAIRLLRANILRMIEHEDVFRVYFYTDNSKEYHEFEPNYLEIDGDMAPAVEYLIKTYPKYVTVGDLPLDEQLNMDVANALWNRGLIMLQKPSGVIEIN